MESNKCGSRPSSVAANSRRRSARSVVARYVGEAILGVGLALFTAPVLAATTEPLPDRSGTQQPLEPPTPIGPSTCSEAIVTPKGKTPGQVGYSKEAQLAEIEGVVKVQVHVDRTGKVTFARVVGGLGYGLDEIARAAAITTVFEPATRCGEAIEGSKTLRFRFELQ